VTGAPDARKAPPMGLRAAIICAMMIAVSLSAARVDQAPSAQIVAPDIDAMLPDAFGDWRRVMLSAAILPAEAALEPGEAVAYRAYRDGAGRTITLVAAYGPPLGDSVRLHRPESCYVAQGFAIRDRSVAAVEIAGRKTPIVRLSTEDSLRKEAVSYWLRDGAAYISSAPGRGFLDLKRGGGADGALIRVSSHGDGAAAFMLQSEFLKDFANALTPAAKRIFIVTGKDSQVQS